MSALRKAAAVAEWLPAVIVALAVVIGGIAFLVGGEPWPSSKHTSNRTPDGRGTIVLRDTRCECGTEIDPQYGGSQYWSVRCPTCGKAWTWGEPPASK